MEIPPRPQKAFGFARLKTKHHIDHKTDMGFKDETLYQRAAIEFWNVGKGTIYYSTVRDHFVKETPDKTKMVSIDRDGTIKTYFKFKSKKERDKYAIQQKWIEIERV